jgi:hypothetical protein
VRQSYQGLRRLESLPSAVARRSNAIYGIEIDW